MKATQLNLTVFNYSANAVTYEGCHPQAVYDGSCEISEKSNGIILGLFFVCELIKLKRHIGLY